MPEMYFDVRWPDGPTQRCYSPSTIVRDCFAPGAESSFCCTGADGSPR